MLLSKICTHYIFTILVYGGGSWMRQSIFSFFLAFLFFSVGSCSARYTQHMNETSGLTSCGSLRPIGIHIVGKSQVPSHLFNTVIYAAALLYICHLSRYGESDFPLLPRSNECAQAFFKAVQYAAVQAEPRRGVAVAVQRQGYVIYSAGLVPALVRFVCAVFVYHKATSLGFPVV